jgi:hypothetical protein
MGKTVKTKKKQQAVAVLAKAKDGTNVVGIGNLRVVIAPDGDMWFAQGLEIDFAASGDTIDDVKSKFESGLACMIHEHLKMFGNIKGILKVAPVEVWVEMYAASTAGKKYRFSHVSHHELAKLQFEGITYLEKAA